MARQEVVTLVDDLDGSAADETVRFSLGKETFEIDLSKANAKKLRDSLTVYVNAARKVGRGSTRNGVRASGRPRGRTGRRSASSATPTSEIRAWAKSKGIKVNERGRISADVVAKYEAAH